MQIRLIRKPGVLPSCYPAPWVKNTPRCLSLGCARERGVYAEPFNGVPGPWLQTSTSLSSPEPVILGKEAPQLPLWASHLLFSGNFSPGLIQRMGTISIHNTCLQGRKAPWAKFNAEPWGLQGQIALLPEDTVRMRLGTRSKWGGTLPREKTQAGDRWVTLKELWDVFKKRVPSSMGPQSWRDRA